MPLEFARLSKVHIAISCRPLVVRQRHRAVILHALGKAPNRTIWRGRCGNGAVRLLVDVAHAHGLHAPVGLVVLNNAERVHPEVAEPKRLRDFDPFLNGLGQGTELNALLVLLVRSLRRLAELAATPAVAQGCVLTPCAVRDEQEGISTRRAHIEDSGWQLRIGSGRTVVSRVAAALFVCLMALASPPPDGGHNAIRAWVTDPSAADDLASRRLCDSVSGDFRLHGQEEKAANARPSIPGSDKRHKSPLCGPNSALAGYSMVTRYGFDVLIHS